MFARTGKVVWKEVDCDQFNNPCVKCRFVKELVKAFLREKKDASREQKRFTVGKVEFGVCSTPGEGSQEMEVEERSVKNSTSCYTSVTAKV